MVSGLDAVALAIFSFESGHLANPASLCVRNNNPGNLRLSNAPKGDGGFSLFADFLAGYGALISELTHKFTGNNAHGIKPDSTLLDLFNVYAPPSDNNPTNAYAEFVANFVTLATDIHVTVDTKLQDIWTPT
jgi:hypothetical protein